ncbi:hypothetical protein JOE21_001167 [Desmospora profundinema]|uniref:Uncharacterized protein n=1 Tax=Desmospora profundinema TaxID=1571184 RepID=A0ABU1IK83_9BACL|nr:hypothetical protein [Desmospora profundinema]
MAAPYIFIPITSHRRFHDYIARDAPLNDQVKEDDPLPQHTRQDSLPDLVNLPGERDVQVTVNGKPQHGGSLLIRLNTNKYFNVIK